jgi:hypothetical protein
VTVATLLGSGLRPARAADLTMLRLKLVNTGPSVVTGRISGKCDFITSPPTDTFDALSPISFHLTDAVSLDVTHTWSPTECITSASGKIKCKSVDGSGTASFFPVPATPEVVRCKFKISDLNIHAPFTQPIVTDLEHGTTPTTRTSSFDECKTLVYGMLCRRL